MGRRVCLISLTRRITLGYSFLCPIRKCVKHFLNPLGLRDPVINNQVNQAEQSTCQLRIIFKGYFPRMDCIVPNDTNDIKGSLNIYG